MELRTQGFNAMMLYLVQREDVNVFAPAWEIDPVYASLLVMAHELKVKIQAWQCKLSLHSITLARQLPVNLALQ